MHNPRASCLEFHKVSDVFGGKFPMSHRTPREVCISPARILVAGEFWPNLFFHSVPCRGKLRLMEHGITVNGAQPV